MLKEVEEQGSSIDFLKNTSAKTFERIYSSKKSIVKKFKELYENNQVTLKQYTEGLADLKKYELHQALKKENKQVLMDIYYNESQMNKWRDSCLRN